ncbi:MAG: DUF1634 domain-containing protein [Candidatus Nitrosopolaris sp.]
MLIVGVFLSLVLIIIGLLGLHLTIYPEDLIVNHILLRNGKWMVAISSHMDNFISLRSTTHFASNAIKIMALGLVILIITPFVRVFASVVFFAAGITSTFADYFICSNHFDTQPCC